MGEVYLAHDPRLARKVAIKALHANPSTDPLKPHTLFQEARAAAALTHPNIAAIHDVIEVDGHPMIVMEYVPGESLDARLRRERPSIDQAIEWAVQIASGLSAAHARDIVHCDIKPGNIRLMPDGAVKVLDFGLASVRSLQTASRGAPSTDALTTVASLPPITAGTPPYMSPEQVLARPVDQRTDVYALGVVLFEMLGGRRPFDKPDPLDLSLDIVSGSAPSLVDVNPSVPLAVAAIVAKAMARSPSDRYQSASALADAL